MPARSKRTGKMPAKKTAREIKQPKDPKDLRDPLVSAQPGYSSELVVVSKRVGDPASEPVSGGSVKAPPPTPSIKLIVVGPTLGGRTKRLDNPVFLDLFDLVQQRHGVQIEHGVLFPDTLTVGSSSRQRLSDALTDIYLAMHYAVASGCKPLFIVHASAEEQKKVMLQRAPVGNTGSMRFATPPSSSAASGPVLLGPIAAELGSRLAKLAPIIRAASSNISLQIHLGRMMVFASDKPGRSVPPAVQLRTIVDDTNTDSGVSFDRSIGDGRFFDVCRTMVTRSTGHFFPTSSVINSLGDVPLERTLVVITAAFRIDFEISAPKLNSRVARLSCLRVLQLTGATGKTDLTVACPNHHLDWKLETIPEIMVDDIPASVKGMMAGISISYTEHANDFPIPEIPASVLSAHRINHVYGKTSWMVGCKGSKDGLELELCRFHKFPQSGKAEGYKVSTCISIMSPSWREALKAPAARGTMRDIDASWSQVFRPRRKRDGISELLTNVQNVLAFWDKVFADGDVRVVAGTTGSLKEADEAVPIMNKSLAEAVPSPNIQKGYALKETAEDDLISFD